ncbi:MAG TPA: ATP-binding protein [Chloroflexota bacterium]|nr:ATP-binding protein [Chloroflexota bacterium]
MGPVQQGLRTEAQILGAAWQQDAQQFLNIQATCPVGPQDSVPGLLVDCYDAHGHLLGQNAIARATELESFTESSLPASAIGNGRSEGTIRTPARGDYDVIERYAARVVFPGQGKGVVLVGSPVGTQVSTLTTLLHLLLLLGGLTILLSLGTGLFLANRALLPARLAYQRQRDFIADASHELRTPLTMLRSSIELVLRGRHLPPQDAELLQDTVQEVTHLTALANSLLTLARLDTEGAHLEQDVIDLAMLSDEVTRWAQPLATERGLLLRVEASSPLLVIGDNALLQQAILILVDNAIKYNVPEGFVLLRTRQQQNLAEVEVRDGGMGISEEHLSHLGERFYRVDKARSRESGGAGLGLSIVNSIVRRHHGSFKLESQVGVGTVATIKIPLIDRTDGMTSDNALEKAEEDKAPEPASHSSAQT